MPHNTRDKSDIQSPERTRKMIVIFWIVLAIILGVWVGNRGRSGLLATVLALLFSPFIMWLVHLAIGPKPPAQPNNTYDGPIPASEPPVDYEATRRCQACAELVLQAARKCKHCGESIEATAKSDEGIW
jgi:hypothetical protein